MCPIVSKADGMTQPSGRNRERLIKVSILSWIRMEGHDRSFEWKEEENHKEKSRSERQSNRLQRPRSGKQFEIDNVGDWHSNRKEEDYFEQEVDTRRNLSNEIVDSRVT
jgi:hypothetical protein